MDASQAIGEYQAMRVASATAVVEATANPSRSSFSTGEEAPSKGVRFEVRHRGSQ